MRFTPVKPPRLFQVGLDRSIRIKDCARIQLKPNEQVTFVAPSGAEYDVARKSWGYYATPSLNGRLQTFGLRGVLVQNSFGKLYLFLVGKGRVAQFRAYLKKEKQKIVCWLDSDKAVKRLVEKMGSR